MTPWEQRLRERPAWWADPLKPEADSFALVREELDAVADAIEALREAEEALSDMAPNSIYGPGVTQQDIDEWDASVQRAREALARLDSL